MATTTREKFDNIIEIKNVTKVFDGITAVDNVNLAVRRSVRRAVAKRRCCA